MANFRTPICMALALAATNSVAFAQPSGTAIPVTVDNYNRAQTDVYFGQTVKRATWANSGMAASWRRLSTGA